jgi:hypothetical protein
MITDGKPTCLKVGIKYYKNAFGIDSKILRNTKTRSTMPKTENSRYHLYDCFRSLSQRICEGIHQSK